MTTELITQEQIAEATSYYPALATLPADDQATVAATMLLYQQWVAAPAEKKRQVLAAAAVRLHRPQRGILRMFTILNRTQDLRILIPAPRADKGRARAWDDLALAYLKERYIRLRNKSNAWRETSEVCDVTGWRFGSYRNACAHMKEWDADSNTRAIMVMTNKRKEYEDKYEVPILRDKSHLVPLEIICGDHHQFDVVVMWHDGTIVRPWLSAWIDVRTGLWMGLTVCRTPDAKSIADSLYVTIRKFGVPHNVYIDNGKAYRAALLKGTRFELDEIGRIDLDPTVADTLEALQQGLYGASRRIHALPFNARAKIVERHFGTGGISDWCKALPGYTGRRYDDMPDTTRKLIKARKVLRLDDFLVQFIEWVRAHNERPSRGHAMGGKSPMEVLRWFFASGWRPTTAPDPRILDLIASRKIERRVQRFGIQHMGATDDPMYYYDERLRAVIGEKVVVAWSDADLVVRQIWAPNEKGMRYRAVPSRVMVYHNGRFVCEAVPVERTRYIDDPTTGERIREQRRRRKQLRSELDDMTNFREYIDATPEEAARLTSAEIPEPTRLRLVKVDKRTDFARAIDEERKRRSYLDLAHKNDDDTSTNPEADHGDEAHESRPD